MEFDHNGLIGRVGAERLGDVANEIDEVDVQELGRARAGLVE